MKEENIDIQTKDGNMNTFITRPNEGGPFPPVIFYMDAPGKREELHDMARRIATIGYYVVLPNLYYRDVREFHLGMPGATRERMAELMANLSNAMVCEDTQSMMDHIDNENDAKSGPIGITGYCMSGPFVFAAAAAFPERIKAAASVHGVALFTEDETSPHLTADQIKGEMYFACAENDIHAPKEMIDGLEAHLKTLDINYRVEWFDDTQHGFVFPRREGMFDKQAAEDHWSRLFAMFARQLQ